MRRAPAPASAWQPDAAAESALSRVRASDDALGGLLQRCVGGRCDCGGKCGRKRSDAKAGRQLARIAQPTLQRAADPKHCCDEKGCSKPDKDGSGADATKWTLVLAVDREEKGWDRVSNPEDVGHTWVKLKNNVGEQWSFGMWPQGAFKFFSAVKGCVHHPDTEHDPPAATEYREISYDITREQYYDALSFAQQQCELAPDYDLTGYNCTTFAISTAIAAGVSPPASTTLAVHNPNALYSGIGKELEKRGESKAAVKGSGSRFGKGGPVVENGVVIL